MRALVEHRIAKVLAYFLGRDRTVCESSLRVCTTNAYALLYVGDIDPEFDAYIEESILEEKTWGIPRPEIPPPQRVKMVFNLDQDLIASQVRSVWEDPLTVTQSPGSTPPSSQHAALYADLGAPPPNQLDPRLDLWKQREAEYRERQAKRNEEREERELRARYREPSLLKAIGKATYEYA